MVATAAMAATVGRAGMPTTAAMAAPAKTYMHSGREGKDSGGGDSENTSNGSNSGNSVNGGEGKDHSNSTNGGEGWQRPQK